MLTVLDDPSCDWIVVDFRPVARQHIVVGGIGRKSRRKTGILLSSIGDFPLGLTSEGFCLLIVPS